MTNTANCYELAEQILLIRISFTASLRETFFLLFAVLFGRVTGQRFFLTQRRNAKAISDK